MKPLVNPVTLSKVVNPFVHSFANLSPLHLRNLASSSDPLGAILASGPRSLHKRSGIKVNTPPVVYLRVKVFVTLIHSSLGN